MRLARRALVAALAMLVLHIAVPAQTLRAESDPRNIAPTVGSGGPVGGPTGLFTVYDAQTLRRGEFTLSLSYSNFDRDPGDVDITEALGSVQIGISDYLEVFVNADHYRGVKVNSPLQLSSFYLTNITAPPGRGAAIILAPQTNRAGITQAVFRPPGTDPAGQPFVAYPFIGGAGPNFGFVAPNGINSTLGRIAGEDGRYSRADNYPGIGAVVGSILPGIVLQSALRPAGGVVVGPGATTGAAILTPTSFTIDPSYLPDAPFIGRTYGQSAFSTFTVGGKIRFTGPDNPLGVALLPFYRFYLDKSDDASGFNQLQRGASPGANFGDIGLVLAVDGRISRGVNVSANIGYILNSNPNSDTLGTPLDRGDELLSGIAFDFPVNRYFQPIAELRSTIYVGGRTPNAFQNNPVDTLLGIRVFPGRYIGFSAAYRRHLNQQDGENLPAGFRTSDDPNGFLGQFFIGRRNERAPEFLPNQPPTVTLTSSAATVTIPAQCPAGQRQRLDCPVTTNLQIPISATASDPDGDTLLYTYTTTGGRVSGEGANATLDLTGVQPGTYTTTVEVDDGCGCVAFASTTITVNQCECEPIPPPPCPEVTLECPTGIIQQGTPATATANLAFPPAPDGGQTQAPPTPTFNWTVSAGTVASGQGTNSISIDTTGLAGQSITATVTVGGLDPTCTNNTASCTIQVAAPPESRKFDEYGRIANDDVKARLDNFAVELQNSTGAQATIIGYGGRRGVTGEAQRRADFARDYLVNQRQIDVGRITTIDGGFREEATTELYIVPTGATAPAAAPTVEASEVQTTRPPRRRGARRRRR